MYENAILKDELTLQGNYRWDREDSLFACLFVYQTVAVYLSSFEKHSPPLSICLSTSQFFLRFINSPPPTLQGNYRWDRENIQLGSSMVGFCARTSHSLSVCLSVYLSILLPLHHPLTPPLQPSKTDIGINNLGARMGYQDLMTNEKLLKLQQWRNFYNRLHKKLHALNERKFQMRKKKKKVRVWQTNISFPFFYLVIKSTHSPTPTSFLVFHPSHPPTQLTIPPIHHFTTITAGRERDSAGKAKSTRS
jgi:hypothetical protein